MNREELKECVKWLRKAVSVADSVALDKYYLIGSNVKVIVDALEVYEKLLSLPQRTIETLEVGDIVLTKNDVLSEIFATTIRNETLRYTYISHKDWFNVVQIIPHEAIELLKGVI